MRILLAAMMVVSLAGTAYAQNVNVLRDERARSPEEREKDRLIEEQYKAEMKKIPDQKNSSDPWGTVRSTDTSKQAPATTARKPKQN